MLIVLIRWADFQSATVSVGINLMAKRLVKYISVLLLLFGAGFSQAGPPSWEGRLEYVQKVEGETGGLGTIERGKSISRAFDSKFESLGAGEIRSLSTVDLSNIYQAAHIAAFYSTDAKYIHLMERVFLELEERGGATSDQRADMHGAYILARDFHKANSLLEDEGLASTKNAVPLITQESSIAEGSASFLELSQDGGGLVRREFSPNNNIVIIVVSHPLCSFSRAASHAIEMEPILRDIFFEHAVWITPVDRNLNLEAIGAWNRARSFSKAKIAYSIDEWPWVSTWETPSFYFIRDGDLFAEIIGWPEGGRNEEIKEILRRLDIVKQTIPGSSRERGRRQLIPAVRPGQPNYLRPL